MATKKNMAVMIATIKSIYPYYAKDTNIEVLAKTWLLLLQDYDDKIINNALMLCMKECETPPTPAHIIKKIEDMQPKKTVMELWSELVVALQKVENLQDGWQYLSTDQKEENREKCQKIYDGLDDELKFYLGSYGEMIRSSKNIDPESLKFSKQVFLKTMPEIIKTHKNRLLAQQNFDLLTDNKKIENN